ncbi:MAG: CRISPR-associated protein Cas2 [Archaeoglobi archaeon]|nr:CRISPR-associated protein Cas2 [Archaeoglobi archaeon]
MITLVIYDISEDEVRNKIAKLCKSFGLHRIQKSAFLGEISSSRRKELSIKLRRSLKSRGNVQIFVICKPDFALREIIGDPSVEDDYDDLIII